MVHHGNYLHSPFWNFRKKRKVPLHTTATLILTPEQIATMSAAEINARLREALDYDDYRYQKENNIIIDEPYRAEGMHKILYMCPHCKSESQMDSKGAEIFCKSCGKRWTLLENGSLNANEGETEFEHVPDWFAWEREQVKLEIERGEYRFEDDVDVFSQPRCWKFEHLGDGHVVHDPETGFTLVGHYNGEEYRINREPIQNNSLHIEYDWCYVKAEDCFDISTENDSFFCYPKKQNVVTKLAFATEILYEKHMERTLLAKKKNTENK
jgi:DNA-directed RNA polymerase subunit RPC12/RpoP